MGVLDFLSPLLTNVVDQRAASMQGTADANALNQKNFLTQLELMRQQHEQQQKDLLMASQRKNYDSETTHRAALDAALSNPNFKPIIGANGEIIGFDTRHNTATEAAQPGASSAPPPAPTQLSAPQPSMEGAMQNALSVGSPGLQHAPNPLAGFMPQGTPPASPLPGRTPLRAPVKTKNIDRLSPEGQKAEIAIAKGTAPFKPQFSFGTTLDASGASVSTKQNRITGAEDQTNLKTPITGQGGVSRALSARVEGGISEMEQAHAKMLPFDQKMMSGTANIEGLDQFIKDVGDNFAQEGVKAAAVRAAALSRLNTKNPELARYVRNGLAYAEGESSVSQRPSDFRIKMSSFLSTAATGMGAAHPELVQDIVDRRARLAQRMRQGFGGTSSEIVPGAHDQPQGKTITQAQWNAAKAADSKLTDADLPRFGYKVIP